MGLFGINITYCIYMIIVEIRKRRRMLELMTGGDMLPYVRYARASVLVGFGCIGGSPEVELFLCQVFLDVFVLDRRAAVVDEFHLFGNHIRPVPLSTL